MCYSKQVLLIHSISIGNQDLSTLVLKQNRNTEAIRGEILLTLNKLNNKETFISFDNYINLLNYAIPDSQILPEMSVARTKAAYLTTEAIGPYFRKEMISSYDRTSFYCLLFDETTNDIKKKELQIAIRFFSQTSKEVIIF